MSQHHSTHPGSVLSYSIGFVLSILLTIIAFGIVIKELLSGWPMLIALAVLATLQLLVQLVFFLHLGRESKPRWNLNAFAFMVLTVLILVVGTLWIMKNLDYHMMESHETEEYMLEQKDKGF